MNSPPRARISRETRLLLIVITLSAGVLFVLSKFRFPDGPPPAATTSATPLTLERLAARATYDELASIIAQLDRRVTPSVTVLEVDAEGSRRFVPALRVRPDLLIAHVEGTSRILSLIGEPAAPDIVAYDEQRRLVLLRVPANPGRVADLRTTSASRSAPRYIAAVEGTRGGPALRPLFLGRLDLATDDRYPRGLLMLGGVITASAGSLLYSLDGSFIGLCIVDDGVVASVPGETLEAAVARMLTVQ